MSRKYWLSDVTAFQSVPCKTRKYTCNWLRLSSHVEISTIARTRSFPGVDIGSYHDLLMLTFRLRLKKKKKKNQQAKTHKTQVWPRKAERSQRVGNLPSYDRREVCTSHHHEQRRQRHRFNDHHLQHSSDWKSQWDPWQTSTEEKTLDHCRNSWSVGQKERNEKEKIWAWRIWEIQGSEPQHQEVLEKG